ncbi:hypothetical protein [Deefgea rivuli]|uniref:hypothetical protein n=1 Tax=Deefgea rivuli TaxID=400948 RepID=UPI0012EC26CA|nr:hypothetical protein [Deefgea rivuli]
MSRMRLKVESYVSNDKTLWAYSLLKGGRDEVYSTSSGYLSKDAAHTAGKDKLAELEALRLGRVGA